MKIIKLKIQNYKHGYAILELLFYIVLFSILSLAVINAMIVMTRSFRETAIHRELVQSGNIMERITREMRASLSISSISASDLKLNTKDNAGADKTVRFVLSGSDIQFFENDVLTVTGSSSIKLKGESELFPGRRGRGKNIMVHPLSFREFLDVHGVKINPTGNLEKDMKALFKEED